MKKAHKTILDFVKKNKNEKKKERKDRKKRKKNEMTASSIILKKKTFLPLSKGLLQFSDMIV